MCYCGGTNDIQDHNWVNGLQAADHYLQNCGLGREVSGCWECQQRKTLNHLLCSVFILLTAHNTCD